MMTPEEANLEHNITKAARYHGHLCPGTVVGVRMSMLGLEKIKITDPMGSQRKDIMAFVENDRCNVDAIQSITGCKVSARALKLFDYGKVAATFLNLKTGKAVRVVCPERTRELVDEYCPVEIEGKKERAIAAYKKMPLDKLFEVHEVKVAVREEDKPGHATYMVNCENCEETVSDHRECTKDGRTLCRACAGGGYYTPV